LKTKDAIHNEEIDTNVVGSELKLLWVYVNFKLLFNETKRRKAFKSKQNSIWKTVMEYWLMEEKKLRIEKEKIMTEEKELMTEEKKLTTEEKKIIKRKISITAIRIPQRRSTSEPIIGNSKENRTN